MGAQPSLDLETGEYNEAKATGEARRNIAYFLLATMALVIVMAFIALAWALSPSAPEDNFKHLVGLMNVVFGPVVTLVGSATGYYFGAQTAQQRNASGTGA